MNNDKYYVVHLLDDYSGSPKVLVSLLETLEKHNYCFDIYVGKGSEGFISNRFKQCKYFFYKRSEYKLLTLLSYLVSQIHLFFKLINLFYKERSVKNKIVIVNTILPFGAALAAKASDVKVIYYIHETSIKPFILKKILLKIVEITCDKTIFVSEFILKDLHLNIRNQAVIYNPLPIEYSLIHLEQEDFHKKWLDRKILMACSLKDYKGIPEFIELACALRDHAFILVVNDTLENSNIYFSRFNLPENLHIELRPRNLVELYIKSFLVVNLSDKDRWIETFGLTLLEGMSSYTPVICPIVGGPIEVVRNNKDGFHIDAKSQNILIEKIKILSSDYNTWYQFSNSAKERSGCFSLTDYEKSIQSNLYLTSDCL